MVRLKLLQSATELDTISSTVTKCSELSKCPYKYTLRGAYENSHFIKGGTSAGLQEPETNRRVNGRNRYKREKQQNII